MAATSPSRPSHAQAHRTSLASGHATFQNGLALLRELGTVADLPIYLCMHATLLGLAGKIEPAIDVVNEAIGRGEETGHAYWLAELHRCRAILRARAGERKDAVATDLRCAVEIAESQGATALIRRARHSMRELGIAIGR